MSLLSRLCAQKAWTGMCGGGLGGTVAGDMSTVALRKVSWRRLECEDVQALAQQLMTLIS